VEELPCFEALTCGDRLIEKLAARILTVLCFYAGLESCPIPEELRRFTARISSAEDAEAELGVLVLQAQAAGFPKLVCAAGGCPLRSIPTCVNLVRMGWCRLRRG